MKNFLFGFILGYLTLAFMSGGVDAVAYHISWAFGEIKELVESLIIWIQNYIPKS